MSTRAVVQRVSLARVAIDGAATGRVEKGRLVLLGVTSADTERHTWIMRKRASASAFFGTMQERWGDIGGNTLVVSQFTLYADTAKGNRPLFAGAAESGLAEQLHGYFCEHL